MNRIARAACLGILVSCIGSEALRAQAPAQPAAPTSFEVTSVKPSDPNATGPFGSVPMMLPQGAGGLRATNMPLRLLVRMAYGVQDFQIVGGPSWQMSSKFDITAKSTEGTTKGMEDLLPLVKTLLADRFKLKTHMETRDLPTYLLVVARSDGKLGPDIKPSTSDCSGAAEAQKKLAEAVLKGGPAAIASMLPKPGETVKCGLGPAFNPANPAAGFGLRADGQPMTMLTQMLTQATGRTVIDKTGLTGLYDWELRFDPQVLIAAMAQQAGINIPAGLLQNASPAFADSPSLLTALNEQLGLKLDSQRGPVEVLVIDSAELPEPD
jgi:uncharacterized protein (TIGR03435 family)